MQQVKSHFRPEFLNRLDEMIIFNKLSSDLMVDIVNVQLLRLIKRLKNKNISLELDDSAKKYLAIKGYDPNYGARPLKRVIQRDIENILAQKILKNEIKDNSKIKIKAKNNKLQFNIIL